jgi:hypothetical protein
MQFMIFELERDACFHIHLHRGMAKPVYFRRYRSIGGMAEPFDIVGIPSRIPMGAHMGIFFVELVYNVYTNVKELYTNCIRARNAYAIAKHWYTDCVGVYHLPSG